MAGYKDALIRTEEDGTTISRAYSGKTMRVVRNEYTRSSRSTPTSCSRSPPSSAGPCRTAPSTWVAARTRPDIDPERECYPTGQGVGAIQTLIPAASLVDQIVAQAEQVLAGLGRLPAT